MGRVGATRPSASDRAINPGGHVNLYDNILYFFNVKIHAIADETGYDRPGRATGDRRGAGIPRPPGKSSPDSSKCRSRGMTGRVPGLPGWDPGVPGGARIGVIDRSPDGSRTLPPGLSFDFVPRLAECGRQAAPLPRPQHEWRKITAHGRGEISRGGSPLHRCRDRPGWPQTRSALPRIRLGTGGCRRSLSPSRGSACGRLLKVEESGEQAPRYPPHWPTADGQYRRPPPP